MKWKKWGVHLYMREYLARFFPGREAEAKRIGLITDEIVENVNLLESKEDIGDKEEDFAMICSSGLPVPESCRFTHEISSKKVMKS